MKALHGTMTALVTPFDASGAVDERALRELVRWQVESGIDALVPCGTTGEGATLSVQETERVLRTVVDAAAGAVPVVAGCGSNDTRRTVENARRAAACGVDALLVVTPYYNKPNRSGMTAHFRAVADATDRPIVLYNVPGRTAHNLGADGILRIAEIPGIVAVKEASGSIEQIATVLAERRPGFAVLAGDDALALPVLALGGDGLVSVIANEAPAETARMIAAARSGDFVLARSIHFQLLPLMRANFLETNPVPVKTALALLGRCRDDLRLPLGPCEDETREALREALHAAGLLRLVR